CSMYPDEGQLREFRELGIQPLTVEHRGPRDAPRSIARLVRLMREERIEVVHANRTLDMTLAGTAARMLGIPMVSSLHWLGRPEDHPEDDAPMLWQHAEKRGTVLLNRLLARRIVAVSSAVSQSFSTLTGFPSSRVEVVYPGIALED